MFCHMSVVELVGVKIIYAHVKALEMRMRKLVLGLTVAEILPAKINKMLSLNNLGFIDVNQTVCKLAKILKRRLANKTLQADGTLMYSKIFFRILKSILSSFPEPFKVKRLMFKVSESSLGFLITQGLL